MTADPRVKVVAEALDFLYGTDDLIPNWTGHAVVAVAALDVYDAERPWDGLRQWQEDTRKQIEADLRERIAQAIYLGCVHRTGIGSCRCCTTAVAVARGEKS